MSVFSFRRLFDYNKDDYNTSSQVRRVDCCNADQMTDALPPKDFGSMVIAAGSFYVNRYCQLRLYDSLYNKYLEYDRRVRLLRAILLGYLYFDGQKRMVLY